MQLTGWSSSSTRSQRTPLTSQDAEDLKRNGAALAEVIARLPMPQGNADVKMRFTDLPIALRDLVEDLLDRLAAAVDQDTYR